VKGLVSIWLSIYISFRYKIIILLLREYLLILCFVYLEEVLLLILSFHKTHLLFEFFLKAKIRICILMNILKIINSRE